MPRSHLDDIKNSGLKATVPRLKILELFQAQQGQHLSADDVFSLLHREGTEVGLATVYRVLGQFEQAHILVRNHFENGKAVYELNPAQHHDHLVCMDCGHVEEFVDGDIEKRQHQIAQAHGFILEEHVLSLYASCIQARTGKCPHQTHQAQQTSVLTAPRS
jgi:Fur family ferric uptake transcriptional regulator